MKKELSLLFLRFHSVSMFLEEIVTEVRFFTYFQTFFTFFDNEINEGIVLTFFAFS